MEHTPYDGEIEVTLNSDAESIIRATGDSGPCIPEVEHESVRVKTAARLSANASPKTPGHGLPIQIAPRLAPPVAAT